MYESSFLKITGYRYYYLLQVTNLIGLGILLVLFIILRKSAWKVINTLVPKTDLDRWTHIFFSFSHAIDHVNEKRRSRAEDDGGGVIIDPTEAVFEGIQESKDADDCADVPEDPRLLTPHPPRVLHPPRPRHAPPPPNLLPA